MSLFSDAENDLFLTVAEVSSILRLSVLTIYKYIKEHQLEAVEFGGHYRIQKDSLTKFINEHKVKTKPVREVPRHE